MASFFWFTLVTSVLGLIYAFSKGEGSGWDIAKVVLASIIMIALVVNWYVGGEDPLNDDPIKNVNTNPSGNQPYQPKDPFKHTDFWDSVLNGQRSNH